MVLSGYLSSEKYSIKIRRRIFIWSRIFIRPWRIENSEDDQAGYLEQVLPNQCGIIRSVTVRQQTDQRIPTFSYSTKLFS